MRTGMDEGGGGVRNRGKILDVVYGRPHGYFTAIVPGVYRQVRQGHFK